MNVATEAGALSTAPATSTEARDSNLAATGSARDLEQRRGDEPCVEKQPGCGMAAGGDQAEAHSGAEKQRRQKTRRCRVWVEALEFPQQPGVGRQDCYNTKPVEGGLKKMLQGL